MQGSLHPETSESARRPNSAAGEPVSNRSPRENRPRHRRQPPRPLSPRSPPGRPGCCQTCISTCACISFLAKVILIFLPLLVYDSAIRQVKRHCITARKMALDRADAIAVSIDRAYRECPFDNPNCKQLHVEGPTKYERREIHAPESFMCSTLGHLPTLIPGADAAPSDAIQLVVARSKLKTYERALSSFRAQCDCGWILKDKAQLSDQINFQFVRTNMQAVDVMTELKRAIKFYQLLPISAQKWIDGFATQRMRTAPQHSLDDPMKKSSCDAAYSHLQAPPQACAEMCVTPRPISFVEPICWRQLSGATFLPCNCTTTGVSRLHTAIS